jgi:hypothetical protein
MMLHFGHGGLIKARRRYPGQRDNDNDHGREARFNGGIAAEPPERDKRPLARGRPRC